MAEQNHPRCEEPITEEPRKKPDLRKQKTKKALETAFFELSETQWIEDITVGDICEKAMVRRATFYKHFADKYELFAYVMNNIQRNTNLKQNADPRDISMAEYCVNIARSYIINYLEHPKMVKRLVSSKSRQPYTDILISQIRNALRTKAAYDREKGIETVIREEVLSSFIAGAIPIAVTEFEISKDPTMESEEFIEQLRDIFERICITQPVQTEQNK